MMVALALAVVVLVIIICILLVAFAEQRVQYETRILNLQKEHKQFLEELNRRIEVMRAEFLLRCISVTCSKKNPVMKNKNIYIFH